MLINGRGSKGGNERRNRNSYKGTSVFALKGYQKGLNSVHLKVQAQLNMSQGHKTIWLEKYRP